MFRVVRWIIGWFKNAPRIAPDFTDMNVEAGPLATSTQAFVDNRQNVGSNTQRVPSVAGTYGSDEPVVGLTELPDSNHDGVDAVLGCLQVDTLTDTTLTLPSMVSHPASTGGGAGLLCHNSSTYDSDNDSVIAIDGAQGEVTTHAIVVQVTEAGMVTDIVNDDSVLVGEDAMTCGM